MDPNIVLIVADCLRRDRVGCYNSTSNITPTIDRLATDGRQFKNAYSTGSWTVPAHGSLFTGMYPSEHGTHAANRYLSVESNQTLAGQLSEVGYDTVGFSTNPWVTSEFGFTNGFDNFYDVKSELPFEDAGDPQKVVRNKDLDDDIQYWTEVANWVFSGNPVKRFINGVYQKHLNRHPIPTAETVLSQISQWEEGRESTDPFFLFANFMDTHEPYRSHDEYIDSEDVSLDDMPDVKWNLSNLNQEEFDDSARKCLDAVYDASVQYLDSQLESLLSWLDSSGNMDNTIIIIMSDHGQCLGENQFWGHGTFLYKELVNIPLVVSGPSEYMCSWPDESTTVSIGEVPFYILESIDQSFSSRSTVLQTSAEEKMQDRDSPVMAESQGPHEIGEFSSPKISREGYRAIYFGSKQSLRNLDDDTLTMSSTQSYEDTDLESLRQEFINYEENLVSDLNVGELTENEQEIEEATEQRLKDLGYM